MNKYRIAIIGVGGIADIIARGIKELDNAVLVAGTCRTPPKGEDFATRHDCSWYPDTDAMLSFVNPDVAIICTPSGAHLGSLRLCAKHKVHALVEKPLEITLARVNEMIQTAEQAGITLGGFFPQRFNPVFQLLQHSARQGRFGPLSIISATIPWWRDDAYYGPGRWQGTAALDGGGALINQSIHYIDSLQWLAAATMPDLTPDTNPVEEVFAYTALRAHDPKRVEVEDTAVAVLKFRNGVLGQLLGATSMYPGQLRRLTISGRDGTAELREDELITYQFRTELPEDKETREKFGKSTSHQGGSRDPLAMDYVKHKLNLADFLKALDEKRTPTLSSRESAKAVAIIEACYTSARTGKPVHV